MVGGPWCRLLTSCLTATTFRLFLKAIPIKVPWQKLHRRQSRVTWLSRDSFRPRQQVVTLATSTEVIIVLPLCMQALVRQLQSLLKFRTHCLGRFLRLSRLTRLLTHPKLASILCSL